MTDRGSSEPRVWATHPCWCPPVGAGRISAVDQSCYRYYTVEGTGFFEDLSEFDRATNSFRGDQATRDRSFALVLLGSELRLPAMVATDELRHGAQ